MEKYDKLELKSKGERKRLDVFLRFEEKTLFYRSIYFLTHILKITISHFNKPYNNLSNNQIKQFKQLS